MTIQEVAVEVFAQSRDDAVVIDVRETSEYQDGHIPGAINIPLSTVPDNVHLFAQHGSVYVVCQAGSRSMRACEYIAAQAECANVALFNLAGGTGAWIVNGYEVVTGDQPN
ncbi:MAG: rhodanese-like domain-containing protein [Ilumatobacteraceae bacterium]|nr:rhodanese-like domain-containing protein [Ilumatobacteraceae bacterium]